MLRGNVDNQASYGGCPTDLGLRSEKGHLTGVMVEVSSTV